MSHHPRSLILIFELVLAGACFILVLYHLWLAGGREYRKAHFWIASWSAVSGSCVLLLFFQLTATNPTEAVWITRTYFSLYSFAPLMFVGILVKVVETKLDIRWYVALFLMGVGTTVVVFSTNWVMTNEWIIKTHFLGHKFYWAKPADGMGPFFFIVILASLALSSSIIYRAHHLEKRQRFLLYSVVFGYTFFAFQSLLSDLGVFSVSLLEFGFPLVAAGLTYFVVVRYRRLQEQLEQLVLEQTRQLADKNLSLDRALRVSEADSKAKATFLANMSHELRTPMNGVLGLVEMFADSQLDDEQKEIFDAIQHSGGMLLNILNDLLDLSKIDAGKMTLEMLPFSVEEVIRNAICLLEISAREKGLTLSFEIGKSFPEAILGDSHRLQQVILNLLSNAIKYTKEGSVQIFVEELSSFNNCIEFRIDVSDTGIGISSKAQKTIFDKFIQVDSSSARVSRGAGLGLSISKQLIAMMGGEISVKSEEGVGSSFSVRLLAPVSKRLPKNRQDEPLHPFRCSLRVLIVEDNRVNQIVARRILEKLGCVVETVENGSLALEILEESQFDVVLMDCLMPIMDGFETTKAIRKREEEHGSHIPIIAMTANAIKGDRELCLAVGMDDYIAKPITAQIVRSTIASWCEV